MHKLLHFITYKPHQHLQRFPRTDIREELRITDGNIGMDKNVVKLRDYLETCLRNESRHCSTNELAN